MKSRKKRRVIGWIPRKWSKGITYKASPRGYGKDLITIPWIFKNEHGTTDDEIKRVKVDIIIKEIG